MTVHEVKICPDCDREYNLPLSGQRRDDSVQIEFVEMSDPCEKCMSGIKERITEIQDTTLLTERQSQVYVLIVEESWETEDIQNLLDVGEMTINAHYRNVRNRISLAETTANLEAPDRRRTP